MAGPEQIVAVVPNQPALPATSPAQAEAKALAKQESQRVTTAAKPRLALYGPRNRPPGATVPAERDSYMVTAFADIMDRSLHAAAARFTAGLSPAARRVGEDQPDPLPSQIPSCRITATGSSGTTGRAGPRLCDPWSQKRITPKELPVDFPCEGPSSRPSIEPFLPDTPDAPVELPQAAVVRGSTVVLVVAAKFRVEGGLLLAHLVMSMDSAPFGDAVEGTS